MTHKGHDGKIITRVFSSISRGGTQWVYGGRLLVVSARTNERHYHLTGIAPGWAPPNTRAPELPPGSPLWARLRLWYIAGKETVASARFHGGHPVHHFKGVCRQCRRAGGAFRSPMKFQTRASLLHSPPRHSAPRAWFTLRSE